MQTPPGELSQVQSQLLDNENVLVLTKARFFQTLRILLDYAQHPERRTWESFSYRPWDFVLQTYCLTFNLNHWAVSCGPQHAAIRRTIIPNPHDAGIKVRLEWAQPDFTLMSNAFGKQGQLLFLGEAKPMGNVEPDTVNARKIAYTLFLETEPQRQRQALFAFERHPESDVIKTLMMCGSFWSVWTYKRSESMQDPLHATSDGEALPTDGQSPSSPTGLDDHTSSPDRSPPHKLRRKHAMSHPDHRYRRKFGPKPGPAPADTSHGGQNEDHDAGGLDSDGHDDLSPVPSPPSNHKDLTWRPNADEEPLEIDEQWDHAPPKNSKAKNKAKRVHQEPTSVPSTGVTKPIPAVHHLLRLPNKDVLNPWFRQFLQQSRDTLIGELADQGSVQRSWFDWPADVVPDGDGHSPGYVLPTMAQSAQESEPEPEFLDIIRVDAPPEDMNISGSGLSQAAVNAMMSPGINPSAVFRHASVAYTPAFSYNTAPSRRRDLFPVPEEEDTVLPQLPEALSSDVEDNTSPSPAAEQHRPTLPAQRRDFREASPTDLYLERKQQALHLDSVIVTQPLPPSHASTSREDNVSGDIIGSSVSAEPPNNTLRAPSTSAVPALPSTSAVVDSHTSTTGPPSQASGQEHQGAVSPVRIPAMDRRRREYLVRLHRLALGPLLIKILPNGERVPEDFATMPRADQEMLVCMSVPRIPKVPLTLKDYERGFLRTRMPEEQRTQMLYSVEKRLARAELEAALLQAGNPPRASTSRPAEFRVGNVHQRSSRSAVGRRRAQHSVSSPRPAAAAPNQPDGNADDTQTQRPRASASLAPEPSAATTSGRASGGATSSSSCSADPVAGDRTHSSAERASQEPRRPQAADPPAAERRRDPVAATASRLETLRLDPQPSGSGSAGEGSSNRKRKERQR